jgi:hypothetical protein
MRTRLRRRGGAAAAVAAAVALAALAGGGTATAAASSCKPGVKNVSGGIEDVFCGPAKATISLGGKTATVTQGNCVATSTYLTVNIGVFSNVTTSKSRPDYFGLDVGRTPGSTAPPAGKDGTYRSGVVMVLVFRSQEYSVLGTATLSGKRTQGTVTGTTLTKQAVTAIFHC